MNDAIIRTVWFEKAFPDVSLALHAGTVSSFEGMKMMDECLRSRLCADLQRRGLRSLLPMVADIYQQFWVLLLSGNVVENFNPQKASPWPMIYQNMRWATWRVSMDRRSERFHISHDQFDLATTSHDPCREVDDADLYATICGYAENELSSAKLAALKARYAMPVSIKNVSAIPVENQRVDRHRALSALKARFENYG